MAAYSLQEHGRQLRAVIFRVEDLVTLHLDEFVAVDQHHRGPGIDFLNQLAQLGFGFADRDGLHGMHRNRDVAGQSSFRLVSKAPHRSAALRRRRGRLAELREPHLDHQVAAMRSSTEFSL